MSDVSTLQIFKKTKHQIKQQSADNDLSIKNYVQEVIDLYRDDTIIKIDNSVLNQLKEQASLTIWDESEFLRILLDLYKSQASHKRN